MMNDDNQELLSRSLYELLLPLARLNLHYGLTAKAFSDISKRAYVDAARDDFGIRGRPTNKSRIAALTGLTRVEVQRLLDQSDSDVPCSNKTSPLQRVVSLWMREDDYLNHDRTPASITITADGSNDDICFTNLVSRVGGDIPWQTLLKELIRLGLVDENNGQLQLLQKGYMPQIGDTEKLPFLGSEVSSLIDTISHNLRSNQDNLRFQRKVSFDKLSAEGVIALQNFAHQKGQELLLDLDQLLNQYTVETTTKSPSDTRDASYYAGLGMFVFDAENKKN
ncbi:MAG: hypothetical protein HRU20_07360 [Pseudomonadales bacterium]|nr:hypothetical protein [Pseudomonadales bacterium]